MADRDRQPEEEQPLRVKVKASKALVIAQGPGTFLVKNKTNTVAVFLEVGAVEPGGPPKPAATEAEGYKWEKGAAQLEIQLAEGEALTGIVITAGAEQTLHILTMAPR